MSRDEPRPSEKLPAQSRSLRPFQFSPKMLLIATVLLGVAFGILKWAQVGTTALLVTLSVLAVALLLAIGFTFVLAKTVSSEDCHDE